MSYDLVAAPDAAAILDARPDPGPAPATDMVTLPAGPLAVSGSLFDNWPRLSALYNLFGQDLVPVTPPGCALSPRSSLKPADRGKVPGLLRQDGWVGLNMADYKMTPNLLRRAGRWGANIGLKSTRFPAFDVDIKDDGLIDVIEALVDLGNDVVAASGKCPPRRTGNAPKTLLQYRAEQALPTWRLKVLDPRSGREHYVEFRAAGKALQHVVHGIHPSTGKPYTWDVDLAELAPSDIPLIGADAWVRLHEETVRILTETGLRVVNPSRSGSGRVRSGDDDEDDWPLELLAPSLEDLRELVGLMLNPGNVFPTRHDWVTVMTAIVAAAGPEHRHEALELCQNWSAEWDEGDNDPDEVESNVARINSPFNIGWDALLGMARKAGVDVNAFLALRDFTVIEAGEVEAEGVGATPPAQAPEIALVGAWCNLEHIVDDGWFVRMLRRRDPVRHQALLEALEMLGLEPAVVEKAAAEIVRPPVDFVVALLDRLAQAGATLDEALSCLGWSDLKKDTIEAVVKQMAKTTGKAADDLQRVVTRASARASGAALTAVMDRYVYVEEVDRYYDLDERRLVTDRLLNRRHPDVGLPTNQNVCASSRYVLDPRRRFVAAPTYRPGAPLLVEEERDGRV